MKDDRVRKLLAIGIVIACAVGASCAGQGPSSVGPPVPQQSWPSPQPSLPASATQAVFTLIVPSVARSVMRPRPHYVSPSSKAIKIVATSGSSKVITKANLSPGVNTISVPVTPSGTPYTFDVTVWDKPLVSGAIAGNLLSHGDATATIAAGQSNTVNLILSGHVRGVALAFVSPTPPPADGSAHALVLAVTALDADGNPIVAASAPPGSQGSDYYDGGVTIQLTTTDAGDVDFSNSTIAQPADSPVTVTYDGAAITSATVSTVTYPTVRAVLTPTYQPIPTPTGIGDEYVGGPSESVTVTEKNFSGNFTAAPDNPSVCTVAPLSGTSFSISPGTTAGTCNVTIDDGRGAPNSTVVIQVLVASSSFWIQ